LSVQFGGLLIIDAVLLTWVAAVSVLGALTTVFVRDLRHALPLLVQLVFIGSPVMYSTTLLPHRLRWINSVNPIAVIVDATRDVALRHTWPRWDLLVAHGAVALALLAIAISYARSVEPRVVDVL
jgi:ABC-type polysaccharide/polyol phosphate export permease